MISLCFLCFCGEIMFLPSVRMLVVKSFVVNAVNRTCEITGIRKGFRCFKFPKEFAFANKLGSAKVF